MTHFLTVDAFDNDTVMQFISRAIEFKNGVCASYSNISVANMFFENSTRTKHSFEMAQYKLGLHSVNFDVTTSSVSKGENLYDSVTTMKALGMDMLVIRHESDDFAAELENSNAILINAGSGAGSHPSQSLLDVMTIYDEFSCFEGLTVGIMGDINHSRVAMSNMKLLKRLGATIIFAGPEKFFDELCLEYGTFKTVDDLVAQSDVVMLLRIQLERHEKTMQTSTESYHQKYGLTVERKNRMKKDAIIMHPGPVNRDVEIASILVEDKSSRILNQIENGVFMRMAILEYIIKENHYDDRT